MATAVQKFHEEEALGKTYDFRIARRLFGYLRPYWLTLLPALVTTLALTVLGSLSPKIWQYAIDHYITPQNYAGLRWISLLLLGVLAARLACSYVQDVLLNTIGQRVMYDLRTEIYRKLQRQEVAYYDRTPVGRIMTRLTSDVDALNELFTAGISDLFGDLVTILVIIVMMTAMDWRLTLVSLVVVPLLFAATNWFRVHARRGFDLVRTKTARVNAFLQEHLSGAQTVQLFNAEARAQGKFHDINDDLRNANVQTIFYYAVFFPLVDLIGAVGIAAVIWYGGWLITGSAPASAAVTLGTLVAFIQYSQLLFMPIRDLSDKYNVLQAAVVASHRIFKTLDLPLAITSPDQPKKQGRAEGRIEFRNVWFAYLDQEWVLRDVSFTVEPGQSVAFVGHTGAGKTTITNLLMRFYDVQQGRILLDGVDVRDWDLQSLRENFAVVLQDVFLFSGTVEGNIRLGHSEITDERIRWAAREVQAEPFIERLPEGYASEVKERGAGLSVGQKQLISFARALAFDPALLILDEATSSIDTETEQLIQQAIEKVMQRRTSLLIAHRLSTIQRASRIIVLHHGELREIGTHQELLAQRGLYWRLYKLQYAARATDQTAGPSLVSQMAYGD
jgi:ATP-binding cassette subfamily B protein